VSVVILKPDEIGDFLLATGAIRLLAARHGEANTTLVVKKDIAPLAQREFPRARCIELPLQPRIKGHNQAAANIAHCFPVWLRLCSLRTDDVVCLRTRRDFLQTLFFASPLAARRFASENVLLRSGRVRRRWAENLLRQVRRPVIIPYPPLGKGMPAELASFRTVVSAALEREVAPAEVMPSLLSAPWRGGPDWLLCPFSSRPAKDYSVDRWAAALQQVEHLQRPRLLRLAGGPAQSERLEAFAVSLRSAGLSYPVEVQPPQPLAQFPDLVSQAGLVLTVDTAAAHFACATGAPAAIVASGLHDGVYGPYSPNGRQIWLTGDWAGSGRNGWQESVTSSHVADAIERAIGATSGT